MGEPSRFTERRSVLPVALCGVVLIELNVLLYLRAQQQGKRDNLLTSTPSWVFSVVSSLVVVVLLVLAFRAENRRTGELKQLNRALRSLERITEAAIQQLSLEELLGTLAGRMRDFLGSECAAVHLLTEAGDGLTLSAVNGLGAEVAPIGSVLPLSDPFLGYAARRALQLATVEDGFIQPALAAAEHGAPMRALACPLAAEHGAVGVLEIRFRHARRVSAADIRLLDVAAERAAAAIEGARLHDAERRARMAAEHVRSHKVLIAQASKLFDSVLEDYEVALEELCDVVCPSFADLCMIEQAVRGRAQPLARRHVDAAMASRFDELAARHPGWDAPLQEAAASGGVDLRFGFKTAEAPIPPFVELMLELGMESTIVVPIRVRGLSLGSILLGRAPGRRGFRPSDREAAEDMANRAAVAIERVLLYRETQEGAQAASRQANQLRRLMEAAPEMTAPLARTGVLEVLVEQARRVLGSERAIVAFPGEGLVVSSPPAPAEVLRDDALLRHAEAVFTPAPRSTVPDDGSRLLPPVDAGPWLAVPIPVPPGSDPGVILVSGRQVGGFSDEDEAILVSMVQLAAAALENARLYHTVESNEERLEALVEATPLAIIELGPGDRVKRWNRAASQIFGWRRHDALPGDGEKDPTFDPSIESAITELSALARSGQPSVDVDVNGVRPDGSSLHLAVSTVPLRDQTGAVNGVLAVLGDVTVRKNLESQLFRSQRLEAIGKLAGGIAHDFNNLLTVILGHSELLLRRMANDDRSRQDLEAVRNAGEQAAKVTRQLLAIGSYQLSEPTVVSVSDVIRSLEPVLRRLLPEDVQITLDCGRGSVMIDPGQLEQIFLNLVVNSCDAMPDGGRLIVSSREQRIDIPVSSVNGTIQPGHWVVVSVADSGTGMTEDVLNRCFEPLFTTKSSLNGTGLGLATVYSVVDHAGGHLRIETAPDQGTLMEAYFPAAQQTADEHEDLPPDWLPPGCERILLVEDDAAVRRLAAEALSSQGYILFEASNGAEGLRVAEERNGKVDLVVTDVVMPEMDGVEMANRLLERWPELHVLYISGYTGAAREKLKTITESANFLAKPFRADQLAVRVREILDSSLSDRAATS
jgi:PAS domain S-box-containing protein